MKNLITAISILAAATHAFAWDGYDADNGAYVKIEKGNLVRSGRDIEIYDYSQGEYIDVTVESIRANGRYVEVEVTDHTTGESRTLEMERKR